MGPRNRAYGRHTIAKAAPSNRPVARVGVDKYNKSILLMQRSPIDQYASGVDTQLSPIRLVGINNATNPAIAVAIPKNHIATRGSRSRPSRKITNIMTGHNT